jgi:hypothetical protein
MIISMVGANGAKAFTELCGGVENDLCRTVLT